MEEFRTIKGFENYQVSNLGRIYSLKKRAYIKGSICGRGYKMVSLSNGKESKYLLVHRIVATTFIPNPNNLRTVNHISGEKLDNRVVNLEWADDCTQQHHAYLIGLKHHTKHILTEEEIIEVYKKYSEGRSVYSLAKEYGTRKQQITKLVRGERHSKLFGQYREKFNL